MRRSAFVGFDIGSSLIKAAIFDTAGSQLAMAHAVTPTSRASRGRAEHDANSIWAAVTSAIRQATEQMPAGYEIAGVGCASMGESVVPVDSAGEPIGPMIAWYDRRTVEEAEWCANVIGRERIYSITGQPVDPQYSATKLLWTRRHEPALYDQARTWLSAADFVILRLSGTAATDLSLASRTMLFDQQRRDWSDEMLEQLGIARALLPQVLPAGTKVGEVIRVSADRTGVRQGTPVVLAGQDRLCGAFAVRQGLSLAVDATGTAETLLLPTQDYRVRTLAEAGYMPCFADVVPNQLVFMGRVGLAGAVVDWVRRELFGTAPGGQLSSDDEYAAMMAEIASPLRFSGLLCLATFGRSATPGWDPVSAYGAFFGLTTETRRSQLLQAVLEGVAYQLRANVEWLEKMTSTVLRPVRVEGHAGQNPLWLQLKADVLGRPMEAADADESAALGAAFQAAVGVGVFADHAAASRSISLPITVAEPDQARQHIYNSVFENVRPAALGLVPALNAKLSAIAPANGP